jgi:hypothetical protein
VRINFTWFLSDAVAEFLIEAVRAVARDGWRLLDDYTFEPATGRWTHRGGRVPPPMSLRDVRYEGGQVRWPHRRVQVTDAELADVLAAGRRILAAASPHPADVDAATLPRDAELLRWFPLPGELTAAGPDRRPGP